MDNLGLYLHSLRPEVGSIWPGFSTLKTSRIDTDNEIHVPMDTTVAPFDVFHAERVIVAANGIIGSHNNGIYLIHVSSSDMTKTLGTYKMTPEKEGFYYHLGKWIDLN